MLSLPLYLLRAFAYNSKQSRIKGNVAFKRPIEEQQATLCELVKSGIIEGLLLPVHYIFVEHATMHQVRYF